VSGDAPYANNTMEVPSGPSAREWFTPPEIARSRGLRVSRVLDWIRSGELEAINHASHLSGPPRWRVSAAALAAFDAARSSRVGISRPAARQKRATGHAGAAVEEFF